jgi:hypothetical protein
VDWMDLAQNRDHWRALVNTEMNIKWREFFSCATGGFWRRAQLHEVSFSGINMAVSN